MASIMREQVIADIELSNIVLGSDFKEDYFKEEMEEEPDQINQNSLFCFQLLFDIRNKSSGSGSIEKPKLVLKFTEDNFIYEIKPKTKETWDKKIEEDNGIVKYRQMEEDLGGTIFLRGGDSKKAEIEYSISNPSDELLEHIKSDLESLEYHIKYSDNFGKSHQVQVHCIKPESMVVRK